MLTVQKRLLPNILGLGAGPTRSLPLFYSDIRRLHAHQAQHQKDLSFVVRLMLLYTMDKTPLS